MARRLPWLLLAFALLGAAAVKAVSRSRATTPAGDAVAPAARAAPPRVAEALPPAGHDAREPLEPEPGPERPLFAAPAPGGTLIVRVVPPPGVLLSPDVRAKSEVKVHFDPRRSTLPPDLTLELDGLEPGHHAVRVLVPGYILMERSFVLPRDEALTLEFALDAGLALRGRVVDPEGRPVYPAGVGVTSWVVRPGSAVSLSTSVDEHGRFELLGVPPGEIVLGASWRGWHRVSRELGVLAPTEPHDDLELVLGVGKELGGIVRLPDGTPAPRAEVKLTSAQGEDWENEVRCDPEGRFRFRGLPEGTVSVRAWMPPEPATGSPFDEEVQAAEARHFALCPRAWLEAEAGCTDLEVRLEAPTRLEVRYSGTGEAECRVFDAHGREPWIDPDPLLRSQPALELVNAGPGVLEVLGLTSGTYWLELSGWDGAPRGSSSLLAGTEVQVRAGQSTNVELGLAPRTWVTLAFEEALDSAPDVQVRTDGGRFRRVRSTDPRELARGVRLALGPGAHTLLVRHGAKSAQLELTLSGEPSRRLPVRFE